MVNAPEKRWCNFYFVIVCFCYVYMYLCILCNVFFAFVLNGWQLPSKYSRNTLSRLFSRHALTPICLKVQIWKLSAWKSDYHPVWNGNKLPLRRFALHCSEQCQVGELLQSRWVRSGGQTKKISLFILRSLLIVIWAWIDNMKTTFKGTVIPLVLKSWWRPNNGDNVSGSRLHIWDWPILSWPPSTSPYICPVCKVHLSTLYFSRL